MRLPFAGALDNAAEVDSDGRVDQIAAQCAQPRKDAILVRSREPAVADDMGDQDGSKFPGLAHGPSLGRQSD